MPEKAPYDVLLNDLSSEQPGVLAIRFSRKIKDVVVLFSGRLHGGPSTQPSKNRLREPLTPPGQWNPRT